MKRRIAIIAWVWCGILAITTPVLAGQKGAGSNMPATATYRNDCLTVWLGGACSEPLDRIGSDANGTWPFPYTHGVDGVAATINAAGEFQLDTNTDSGRLYRALYLDFGAPVPDDPMPVSPFPMLDFGFVDAYLSTAGGALTTMLAGAARDVGLMVNFPGWSVRFGIAPWDEGTTPVRVTCVGPEAPGSPCDTWELEAFPTAVAKLLKVSRKGQTEDYGNFYMPFKLTVHRLTR